MASVSFWLLGICCIFPYLSFAVDYHGVTFLFPTDGLTVSHDDTINVTYTSNFNVPLLYTFCRNSSDNNLVTELRENVSPFNGSELVQLKWPNISSCYFDLRPNTSYGYGANSPSLNVLATAGATPSTISLPDSASTNASETGSASSDGTPSSTPSSGSNSGSSSSSGLSTGAKAGIGVGVALGVILIAAVAGFWLLRMRKAKSAANDGAEETKGYQNGQYGQANYVQHTPVQQYHEAPKPQELSSDASYEMPAGEARHELR